MSDTQLRQRRARFGRDEAGGRDPTAGDRRRGRWTGYYPLSEAVADTRLQSLIKKQDSEPKEDR